jgi:hypothetical protein
MTHYLSYLLILGLLIWPAISNSQNKLIAFYDIEECAYGFKNEQNIIVINPRFKKVKGFIKEGLCQVMLNENWGLINKKGEFIVSPVLDEIWNFHPKYMVVPAKKNNRWGFINKSGKWTISPKYKNIAYAQKGYFEKSPFLFIVQKNELNGIVSSSGKEILAPKLDRISEKFNDNGITKVVHNGQYGLIDSLGKLVLSMSYKYLERNYHDLNLPYILTTKTNKQLLCDPNGQLLNKQGLDKIESFPNQIKRPAYTAFSNGASKGFINDVGEIFSAENTDLLRPYKSPPFLLINNHNELLIIDPSNRPYLTPVNSYNRKDTFISYLKDDYTSLFSTDKEHYLLLDEYGKVLYQNFIKQWVEEGSWASGTQYHCQNKNGLYGLYFYNKNHPNSWIAPAFEDISNYDSNLQVRWVKKDNKIGAINALGQTLYDPEFDNIKYLKNETSELADFYALSKNKLFALFNKDHIQLSDYVFNTIWMTNNRIYAVDQESNTFFVPDLNDIKLVPYLNINTNLKEADSLVASFNSNHSKDRIILYKKGGKYGLIDNEGRDIEYSVYDNIREFKNAYIFDDICTFKATQIAKENTNSRRTLIHNFIFEKNIKENIKTHKSIKTKFAKNSEHIFLNDKKMQKEYTSFELNNQELYFKLYFLDNVFSDFFTIKLDEETQLGITTRQKESFESYYIKKGKVIKLNLDMLFEDSPQHTSELSQMVLQKLKQLKYFELGYCANESKFVDENEYFTITKDGFIFHFKDQRNMGSGLWKDLQFSGADIFISYVSIGHLIPKNSILYPLYLSNLE